MVEALKWFEQGKMTKLKLFTKYLNFISSCWKLNDNSRGGHEMLI